MRIYEISKELAVATKDVLEALSAGGFDAKNHMSALSQGAINFLHKKFGDKGKKVASAAQDVQQQKKTSSSEQEKGREISNQKKIIKKPRVKKEKFETNRSFSTNKRGEKGSKVLSAETTVSAPVEILLKAAPVSDVALALGRPVTEVIITLLKWGIVANKNQILGEDVVLRLAEHYQMPVVRPELEKDVAYKSVRAPLATQAGVTRPPIVVVVGHVDHGKTTLLDFIRKTRVASREKGGITQHLGAYQAHTPQGDITFIDTPGHEAFPKIRMRGLRVADIAILIVAADDGLMPQTIEAIKFAKSEQVPIIVAFNKIDKVDSSRLEVLRRQLAQYDLLPEDWGGDVVCVPISAMTGQGIDRLLEMIILQAQLLELQAEDSGPGIGYVLESKIEKGRGAVATLICHKGKVAVGDYFLCGRGGGKISSLVNSLGIRVNQVGPAIPVQVAGFAALPEVGDVFEVVSKERQRKTVFETTVRKQTFEPSLAEEGSIPVILKADNDSSKEAIIDSLRKLSKKVKKSFSIIHSGLGDVVASDVDLAADTGASIIAFHVKTEQNSLLTAQQRKVSIYSFYIIYKLLEFLEEFAQKDKVVELVRKKIGEAIVVRVFDIKGVGVIAGCRIRDGRFSKDGSVVISRAGRKIGEGKLKSLQREKRSVKEVHAGFECGFSVEGFIDFVVDDSVECFVEVAAE